MNQIDIDISAQILLERLPRLCILNNYNTILEFDIQGEISSEDREKVERIVSVAEDRRYDVIFTNPNGKPNYYINIPQKFLVREIEKAIEENGAGKVRIW